MFPVNVMIKIYILILLYFYFAIFLFSYSFIICDWICEKRSYPMFQIWQDTTQLVVQAIASQFYGMNVKTLDNIVTKFELNCFTTHWVMLFQSCKIGCTYKTPFHKSGHIYIFVI